MLPSRLWQKEFIEDFKSSKALAVRFLIPLILLSPLMMSSIPPKMKAGGLAVAVIFLGIFGSAVGMARLRDDRMLERLALLPLSPASIISDYILANSLSDGLQLLVPLILVLSSGHTSPIPILWVLSCFIAALISANAIGVLVALLAESSGEVHLYAFLAVLAAVGLSGLFPGSNPLLNAVSPLLPFHQMSDSLLFSWGLSGLHAPAAVAISSAAIFSAALFLSPRLISRS